MASPLTVHNAEIKTAAVEIRTLTIGGKQVTLAVFRQLREESLIANDGTLNGVPWGIVNYHPDKCGSDREHWHVVWQRGSELLRARVDLKPLWDRIWPKSGSFLLASHVRDLLGSGRSELWNGEIPRQSTEYGRRTSILFVADGIPVGIESEACTSTAIQVYEDLRDAEERVDEGSSYVRYHDGAQQHWGYWDKVKPILAAQADAALTGLDTLLGPRRPKFTRELLGKFNEDVAAEVRRRQAHQDIRTSIGDLPQLFIAV